MPLSGKRPADWILRDVYGGSYQFLTSLAPRYGIETDFVDCTDLAAVMRAIRPETRVLYLETPSNPCLTILDIGQLSRLAHAHGLTVIVDNTFMTPYLQQPLELGADVVVHSATKYLNGHGDVIAGFIVGKREAIQYMRRHIMGDLGQNLNAWDAFLILRGLKTLGLRIRQHCQSAGEIARYLEAHPAIERVYYPGLASHPQHELARRQMSGMGGIVSFEVRGGLEAAKTFMNGLRLAMISFSLGDPETLVQHPASMTHFAIPSGEREAFGITDGLIRFSTGLEDASDIIDDLEPLAARAGTTAISRPERDEMLAAGSLEERIARYEKGVLERYLQSPEWGGDKARIADDLQISLSTLYRKLEKHQLV